jgi:NAD(P)-dependent dehydrogenase (short-subunit alcohol dehydrogenase family)
MHFQGRNVVITGAASGIGRGLAQALAARGARLTLADINLEGAQAAASEIERGGGKASAVRLDVADEAEFGRVLDAVQPLDYLFNNAGYAIFGESRDIPYADWKRLVDVNLLGVIAGSLAAYRRMARQGHGHIVNVASLAGLLGSPLLTAYSMTKSAVVMFSRMLRAEGEALGVKVSVVCPSFIRTGIFDGAKYAAVEKEAAVKQIPFPVMPLAPAVERIVAGVERNEAVIVFPSHARILWRLLRWLPGLSRPIERKALREFREIRKPG